ncbi:MAG: M48 family metalloprotease [Phycisphaerales bacterium]|nr:M48 family metalloprotease [Phycisphaerales bacterium]
MHALILGAFAALYLSEELGAPLLPRLSGRAVPLSLGATGAVLLALWCLSGYQVHRLDLDGRVRRVRAVESAASSARWILLSVHAGACAIGLLAQVRGFIGDVVAGDELAALAPFVLGLCAIEFIVYPVQRRLRDAMTMRSLDRGLPVHPYPSRGRFVWLWARHHVFFMLVPLALLLAWAEGAERLVAGMRLDGSERDAALLGVEVLGLLLVFAFIPPLLVRIWDTVPLRSGPLLERLSAMARVHGVGVRAFLVWRTSGLMLNGAAIGLIRPLRYVVLTDALLDRLTPMEVEAVAAHEIGHIRHRHTPWLAASVVGSVLVFGTPVGWVTMFLDPGTMWGQIAFGTGIVLTLALTLVVLGMVSRRFERQADAFAARHLSGERRGGEAVEISAASALAMSTALSRVAEAHDIIIDRPTFRHGSIRGRMRSLSGAIGLPSDRLPADRAASRARWAVVAMLVIGAALAAADVMLSVGGLGMVG